MAEKNPNGRLEAFCDGVFAIAITLLVIDIKLPETEAIHNSADLWHALRHMAPTFFAFLLSFGVILITWVNHHNHLKLMDKSCNSFLYANGFLLLTVAFIPFPTSLLGEYLLTDHATPAVVLYDGVLTLQAIGWILISGTAERNRLGKREQDNVAIGKNGKFGYFATAFYGTAAILAFWFPLTIAIITTLSWLFWLVFGISIKLEEEELGF